MEINITVNDVVYQVPDGDSLLGLLRRFELPVERLAVELNREVVPRANWSNTKLAAGDSLEIVHFVGGG